MEVSLQKPKMSNLQLRTLTSLILGPIVLFLVTLGSPYLESLLIIALLGMLWEWSHLSTSSLLPIPTFLFLVNSSYFLLVSHDSFSFFIGLIGLSILTLFFHTLWRISFNQALQFLIGTLYICIATVLLAWQASVFSPWFVFYSLILVWNTDTGAYLIGKNFGKTPFAPKISPKKTWEGFIGGTLIGTLCGSLLAFWIPFPFHTSLTIILFSLSLSLTAHVGDLLESVAKRYFKVKDSGTFIPGHGGFLDRLDSLMGVSIISSLILFLTK
jgi:phosphatidate cytidylyltransferase